MRKIKHAMEEIKMCKFCELENQEMIIDTDSAFLYIMNNIGQQPKIYYGNHLVGSYLPINFCPICGEQLVDYENMKLVEEY